MADLVLTREEAIDILDGNPQYKVILDDVVETTRWTIIYDFIFQNLETGKYYQGWYQVGATEMQDERPWEYTTPKFDEVEPYEVTVTKYRKVTHE
jgi:hypothetical protein